MQVLAFLLALTASDGERVTVPPPPTRTSPGVERTAPTMKAVPARPERPTSPTNDPAALARFVADLHSEDIDVREGAVEQLVRADKALVIPLTRTALSSDKEATRIVAVKVLRRIGASTVGRDLARLLDRDRSELVRREVCHALVDCAPKEAPRYLLDAALEDRAVVVRRAAINDLGRLGTVEAAEALVEILEVLLAEEDEYLLNHTTQALTLATDQLHGQNLEGWQHHVAELRRVADEKAAAGELAAGPTSSDEVVIEPITHQPSSSED